jgi:ribonuclease Z
MLLRKYNAGIGKINHIFISHLHGDHIFGLYGFISTLSMLGRKNELHIYAPKELKGALNDHLKYFGEGMTYTPIVHPLNTNEPEVVLENKTLSVSSIPLHHRIPTCGFIFREKTPAKNIHKEFIEQYNLGISDIVKIKDGEDYILPDGKIVKNDVLTYFPYKPRSYAYCSDTEAYSDVAELVKDVDLLYHEATFCEDMRDWAKERGHSTAKQAAEIAKMANAKQLVIGHFSSRYKNIQSFEDEARSIFPNTSLAEEGREFSVAMEK